MKKDDDLLFPISENILVRRRDTLTTKGTVTVSIFLIFKVLSPSYSIRNPPFLSRMLLFSLTHTLHKILSRMFW